MVGGPVRVFLIPIGDDLGVNSWTISGIACPNCMRLAFGVWPPGAGVDHFGQVPPEDGADVAGMAGMVASNFHPLCLGRLRLHGEEHDTTKPPGPDKVPGQSVNATHPRTFPLLVSVGPQSLKRQA